MKNLSHKKWHELSRKVDSTNEESGSNEKEGVYGKPGTPYQKRATRTYNGIRYGWCVGQECACAAALTSASHHALSPGQRVQ